MNFLLRLTGREKQEQEMNEELRDHIERQVAANVAAGMLPTEARRQAILQLGAVEGVKDGCREQRRGFWFETLLADLRYAARMLRNSPGFTAIAILTIALGIGATTAIFSVVDATLLHPLPYPHPEQLVGIEDDLPGVDARDVGMSVPELHDFQRSGIFEYVSTIGGGDVNLTGASQPERIRFLNVNPTYFAVLGVKPQLGRSFNPEDQTPGFTLEATLSDGLWKRAFAADPRILGKSLRLDNDLYTVIGVMPPGFHDPGRTAEERNTEIWLASGFAGPPAPPPLRKDHFLQASIARIKPGLTLAEAQIRVEAFVAALQKEYPDDYPSQSAWKVRLVPLKERVVGNVRQSLILLLGTVGLVLLIGCVNVANLLLARSSARGREMAVRQALGAARNRLIRQLLTESLFLSLLGGSIGFAILFVGKDFLLRFTPESLPRLNEVSMNWAVLLFALVISFAAGAIFGLAPALQAGRVDLISALKQESRGSTSSGEQARTRRVLVVTEFALSLVLLVAAGLLLRSFWDLLNVRPGFNPQSVMAIRTWLPVPNDPATDIYGKVNQEAPFLREVLRRSHTLPGAEEAAIGDAGSVPLGHGWRDLRTFPLLLEGQENQANETPVVNRTTVTPEYFHLLGMTLLRGRIFSDQDNDTAPKVAVINDALARKFWPNQDALGKRFKRPGDSDWNTVIGVIADARTETLAETNAPEIYLSLYQRTAKDLAIFLRGRLDPAAIPTQVREQVQSVDSELPVFGAQMLTEAMAESLAERRFSMEMVALFAFTALLLAGLGIYGVISFLVSERTHEIGIRLALGAQKQNILSLILRQGLTLAIAGALMGMVGAVIVAHLMAGLLYGVRPTDPLTFAGVAALLIGVALLACYIPARRALNVDPIVALRYE
jgi:putative ABC transport system permease protein